MSLILAGVAIPLHASLQLRQVYEPIGGSSVLRMQSGKGLKQTHWRKLRTTLQGQGWIPPGLAGIDYSQPMIMSCIAPRAVTRGSTVIDIPADRRGDTGYEPAGWAQVGDAWVSTPLVMNGDQATLTAVSGADLYMVMYYPQITVLTDGPQEDDTIDTAAYSWSLAAEEE